MYLNKNELKKDIESFFNLRLNEITFDEFDKNLNFYNEKYRNTCVFKNNNLIALNLNNNNISDITVLENYTDLEFLSLSHNKIKDIQAIRNLYKLKKLSLAFNCIENINALRFCDKLLKVYLAYNNISDIITLEYAFLNKKLPKDFLIHISNNPLTKKDKFPIEANRNDLELLDFKLEAYKQSKISKNYYSEVNLSNAVL